jgi:hypothetical protein
MPLPSPAPISSKEQDARRKRITTIARQLGFAGRVEYRHVYSQSGGAQYGRGAVEEKDLLTVYAEAFERDSDPGDFSLEAILAHERGHQLMAWHPRIAKRVAGRISLAGEEILASVLGSIVCFTKQDRQALIGKAVVGLISHGVESKEASRHIRELLDLMEALL